MRTILNALDCPDGELSLIFIDDAQMADLNQQYLHRQGPTNVIAFPMQEGEYKGINRHLLGDVAISIDTACREGQAAGYSIEERLDHLLIHGILHLVGYDHEKDDRSARMMEEQSEKLLVLLKTARI